ncbi:MAG TPA: RNA-guided endonuclease TnpB family protein [Ktedonobacterales bacterium]|nr:RNA-guided endonuclease TnpB family protein [Ktedonobacterales bacterium]
MIRAQTFPCSLAKTEADSLDRESGRHYTTVLVWHSRIYRRTGHWLSEYAAHRLEDNLGGTTILHAHSRDAAQEGFYVACKVAKRQRQAGLQMRYPHRHKDYRTTTWKNTGIRVRNGVMLLSRAKGLEPVRVVLPAHLQGLPESAYKQVELVWDRAGRHNRWHVTLEDNAQPAAAPGSAVVAVDLGEIHPAALTDGKEAVVITARRLRAARQYAAKRLSELQEKQAGKKKGSRRWKQPQRCKSRFLAQQKKRTRDIEHKVSQAVVNYAVERGAGRLAVGDVRDIADGKRMTAKSQQKIGLWSHGNVRQYITYKAQAAGIQVELVDEHDTSKTCPRCKRQHKPMGRIYRCPRCGLVAHRDAVGAVNMLSWRVHGEIAHILPPPLAATKYRCPALVSRQGKRSPLDTGHMARRGIPLREAAGLRARAECHRIPPGAADGRDTPAMWFTFTPMTLEDARLIAMWRYPGAYATYNFVGDVAELLGTRSPFFAAHDEHGELVGFCCVGTTAEIGDIGPPRLFTGADRTLSVGLGLRPDLTGQGSGLSFVTAILDFARESFAPEAFRLFVLAWNHRARCVYERAGFLPVGTITNEQGLEFLEMRLECGENEGL